MKDSLNYKVLLVGGERVKIVQSYTHTYVVQFVSGREQEVHRSIVKSYYPNRAKSRKKKKVIKKPKLPNKKPMPKNNQTKLEF